jgi:DNA-binding MarR family transcriptional regulator
MRSSGRDVAVSKPLLALARADDRVQRSLTEALGRSGLTPTKFNVLMELAASPEGGMALCDIGRRLIRSAPNITTLVDRLEADGFVRREPDPEDRRRVVARITDDGWKALRRGAPAVFEAERALLRAMAPKERTTLERLLHTVAADEE